MMGWGSGMMGSGYGLFFGLLMLLFWLFVIAGVVLLVVWLVRQSSRPTGAPPMMGGGDRALEIARERYAKGEITKDEYERMRKDLT